MTTETSNMNVCVMAVRFVWIPFTRLLALAKVIINRADENERSYEVS